MYREQIKVLDCTIRDGGQTGCHFGTLKFRQPDGSVFSIQLQFDNDPNYWTARYRRPDEEIQEIGVNRVYDPSLSSRSFFDESWIEEAESFDE